MSQFGNCPLALIGLFHPAIDNSPPGWRVDHQLNRVGLVIDDVHENRPAIEVCVASVELGEGAGEIVSEDLVRNCQAATIHRRDPPGLIINPGNRTIGQVTTRSWWADAGSRPKLLYVLGEIKHRVAPRRPFRHLEVERLRQRSPAARLRLLLQRDATAGATSISDR